MKWSADNINWNPAVWQISPMFSPIGEVLVDFERFVNWPSLQDYNQANKVKFNSEAGAQISFAPQAERSPVFEEGYEPRIYQKGEVQTRKNNWHDFFNMSVWRTFPKTKARLNQLQYAELSKKTGVRSALENYMTHFDECGVITLCSDPALIELWRAHRWEALFWENRKAVQERMQFILFGHALYEKALAPYVGFTGKSVVLPVSSELKISEIDQQLSDKFGDVAFDVQDDALLPLPILGVPGWWQANEEVSFYQNQAYFRAK